MTNAEITRLFRDIEMVCNDAIDKLVIVRQASINGRKQKLSYLTKKLEVIVGACNRSLEKLEQ